MLGWVYKPALFILNKVSYPEVLANFFGIQTCSILEYDRIKRSFNTLLLFQVLFKQIRRLLNKYT
jgi:hypothetical protein